MINKYEKLKIFEIYEIQTSEIIFNEFTTLFKDLERSPDSCFLTMDSSYMYAITLVEIMNFIRYSMLNYCTMYSWISSELLVKSVKYNNKRAEVTKPLNSPIEVRANPRLLIPGDVRRNLRKIVISEKLSFHQTSLITKKSASNWRSSVSVGPTLW